MQKDELMHYGRKGQKWGQKIFSKESQGIARTASSGFESASRIAGTVSYNAKPSKKVRQELSQMTDQELRERINRMNMEQQYANLNPSKTARGAKCAKSILEIAGSVAVIGSSAIGIVVGIQKLKKKK